MKVPASHVLAVRTLPFLCIETENVVAVCKRPSLAFLCVCRHSAACMTPDDEAYFVGAVQCYKHSLGQKLLLTLHGACGVGDHAVHV